MIVLVSLQFAPSLYAQEFFSEELFSNHGTIMLVTDVDTGAIEQASIAATRFHGYTVVSFLFYRGITL